MREVEEEETGLVLAGARGCGHRVRRGSGRPKRFAYALLAPTGDATASHEIDEVRWLPLDEAAELLS